MDQEILTVVTPSPMPPEVAKSILSVMRATKQIGFDEKNSHGGYNYVSIDKFMASMRPLLAEAGIFLVMEEDHVEVTTAENEKKTQWLRVQYSITVFHESGASYGPLHRQCIVPASGAQAFASAQSYLLKYFMRALFQIPTGDKDADAEEAANLPAGASRSSQKAAPPQRSAQAADDDPATAEARAHWARISAALKGVQSKADLDGIFAAEGKALGLIKAANEDAYAKLITAANELEDRFAKEAA